MNNFFTISAGSLCNFLANSAIVIPSVNSKISGSSLNLRGVTGPLGFWFFLPLRFLAPAGPP